MAQQGLSRCPGGGACIEDVVNSGLGTRSAKVPGDCDASIGKQCAPPLCARPRSFPHRQGYTGQARETNLWMDLNYANVRLPGPLLDLQQLRFEREGLDGDAVPRELAADRGRGSVIGGQQRLPDSNHEHRGP